LPALRGLIADAALAHLNSDRVAAPDGDPRFTAPQSLADDAAAPRSMMA